MKGDGRSRGMDHGDGVMLVAVLEGSCWWRFWRGHVGGGFGGKNCGQAKRYGRDRDGAGGQMGDGRSQRVRVGRYGRRKRRARRTRGVGTECVVRVDLLAELGEVQN